MDTRPEIIYQYIAETAIERLQCHPGKSGGHVFLVSPGLLQNVSNL